MASFDILVNSILKENSKSLSSFKEDFNNLTPYEQSNLRKLAAKHLKDHGFEDIGSSDISNQLMSWYKSYNFDMNAVLDDLVFVRVQSESLLSESPQYNTTVSEFPVGKILIAKGTGTYKKLDKNTLLGLNGKELPVKKHQDRPCMIDPDINNHDFDLFVDFRTGKLSKEEFNSKIQNKKLTRD